MDTIEPPSFSLGFDLDAASDPQLGSYQNPSNRLIGDGEDEPDPGITVSDSDRELEPRFSSPVLKRLRRGINIDKCVVKDYRDESNELLGCKEDRDDDIEEFSSPEDFPSGAPASTSHYSSCSSRVPLHTSGVFSNQSSISRGKRKQLDVPASAASGISSVASLFQRSIRSPLRMFQLLDSDSEDDHPSCRRDLSGVTKTSDSSSKDQLSQRKLAGSIPCTGDLWKDFSPAISKIQTPALDDVCQDYFSSIKTTSTAQKQSSTVASSSNSGFYNLTGFQQTEKFVDNSHPSPPSHRFFLHNDPRIRNLAQQRLPNFLPLGIVNDRESQREVFLVDYMNQFGSKQNSKIGDSNSKSSRRGQTKAKVSKGQESVYASEGWLNPKTRSTAPKDASKRRVSANSVSAGHWVTSAEGKKVYISKSGQEFSGQSAYRCYKKETGGGFKKSKKKRQPKKKAKN